MEKQNNNEANNNTGVNNTKPSKKKMKTSTIVIIVLAVLLLFSCVGNIGNSGSSSSSVTNDTIVTEDKSSEEFEAEEQEADEVEDGQADKPNEEASVVREGLAETENGQYNPFTYNPALDITHMWIGDSEDYRNSGADSGVITVTVLNCGVLYNYIGDPVVFVDVEIANHTDQGATVKGDDMMLYIDDYQVTTPTAPIETGDLTFGTADVSSGRKAKTTMRLQLPSDYYNANKIEVGLFDDDRTIIVKDAGLDVYGRRDILDTLAEDAATEEIAIEIEEFEYADDDPYNPKNLYKDHIQVENPDNVLSVYEVGHSGEGYYEFLITLDGGMDSVRIVPDAGVMIEYYSGDLIGFYDITTEGIIFSGCGIPGVNGTYK